MSKKKEKMKVESLGKFFGATEFPNWKLDLKLSLVSIREQKLYFKSVQVKHKPPL